MVLTVNVRLPKSWANLPTSEQQRIIDILRQQEEKDLGEMLDLYIKMVCYPLHDVFGFGEYRLNLFLGNHRWLFKDQTKLAERGEQIRFIDEKLSKIFRKDGFPQEMVNKMCGKVEMVEEKKDERA